MTADQTTKPHDAVKVLATDFNGETWDGTLADWKLWHENQLAVKGIINE